MEFSVAGCSQNGFDREALDFFANMMKDSSLKPDELTLASALSACANLGKQIHVYFIRTEFDTSGPVGNALILLYAKSGGVEIARKIVEQSGSSHLNFIVITALLDGYIKLGDINLARQIFDSLSDRDVVAWTAMIVGYVQNGLNNEALELFRGMIKEGAKPSSCTLSAMLSVSSSLASLYYGKQIHSSAIRRWKASSVSVGNALITMCAKAGSLKNAKQVFNQIRSISNTVSWTSMIMALAQHGHGKEAIELFEEILAVDMKPDHITYVGVLSACIHVGLVEQGRRYYHLMQDLHKIEPTLSHYACMIDLYGRARLLQEAHNFIKSMPVEQMSYLGVHF